VTETTPSEVKRRQKHIPTNLSEAKTLYANKLFNVNKLEENSKDHHVKLVCLILTRLLRREYERPDNSEFNLFREYCNNVGLIAYQDNENVRKLIKSALGDNVKDETLSTYFKIVYAFVEMLNLNILNCSVYVEPTKFGRNKLFLIIEVVLFTQVVPVELTEYDFEFKQSLRKTISEFKDTLKQGTKHENKNE